MQRRPSRRPTIVAAALLLAATALPSASLAAPPDETGPQGRDRLLEQPSHGEDAINRLGDRLPDAAARNDLTPAALRAQLRGDLAFWVDEYGQLFAVDSHFVEHAGEGGADDPTQPAAFPYDQTFLLHSNPSANRVIYLDFTGHDYAGTGWDSYFAGDTDKVADVWSLDGSTAFSNAEMDVIQDVWRRVAEDFAPFDVDVTTEEPSPDRIARSSTSDQIYGTRAVITSDAAMQSSCGCGGVAYVGVYDTTGSAHDYYQPAWTFGAYPGAGTGAKGIAEATSHEVGHNLGLSHDGASGTGYYGGHNGWAPIMGVGYSQPITQWSKGEYAGATQTQDDLAVMQGKGLPVQADDHGDDAGTATILAGTSADVAGIIATRDDVDAFTISAGAGTLSLAATPAPVSPNLDIELSVYDGTGALVAVDNPVSAKVNGDTASGMAASLDVTVVAGTYTVVVDGVGRGTASDGYTDYASLGHYNLAGSWPDGGGTPPPDPDPNQAPTAVASAAPATGTAPLAVVFTGSGSSDPDGSIVGYSWSFGDGSGSTQADPSHTYTAAGTYTATLTVTDDLGATDSASVTIAVDEAPATPPPSAPTGLTATDNADGTVTLAWSGGADATSFEIVREQPHRKRGTWVGTTTVATVDGSTFTTDDASGAGTFRYLVRALNSAGSADSGWAEVTVTDASGGDGGSGGGGGGHGKGGKKK